MVGSLRVLCTKAFLARNVTPPYWVARLCTDMRLGWMRGAVIAETMVLVGFVGIVVVP